MAAAAATRKTTTATGTPAKAAKKTTTRGRAVKKAAELNVPAEPVTREELINDETPWDMTLIAYNLGVKHQTVKSWRKDYRRAVLNKQVPHPKLLPEPDGPEIPGKPMWKAGTIRRWAMQTGRMLENGTAVKQKPPGRPARSH